MQPQRDPRGLWLLLLSLVLLLLEVARAGRSVVSCPASCLCASNILSCSKQQLLNVPQSLPSYTALLDLSHNNMSRLRAEWTPSPLKSLHSLLLSHNHLNFISSEAFVPVPNLRYLDLSSNHLHTLDEFLFSSLHTLEVLLLYNNRIVVVDRYAFDDMAQLQKLYLSQNLISRFPLELLKDGNKLPKLMLLDLSSNKLKKLPLEELKKLPAWVKNGLYLHNNPLECDCDLYHLFSHWQYRQLSSVMDFQEDLYCMHSKKLHSVFSLDFFNCSEYKESALEAHRQGHEHRVPGEKTRSWPGQHSQKDGEAQSYQVRQDPTASPQPAGQSRLPRWSGNQTYLHEMHGNSRPAGTVQSPEASSGFAIAEAAAATGEAPLRGYCGAV